MLNTYGIDDSNGANVNPQPGDGSVRPMSAAPSMAEGGVIPEDDEGEGSPNTDVVDYTGAMKIVKQALNYGRQQHGLPASRPQQADDQEQQDTAIPDDTAAESGDEGEASSYAEGGVIEDDIEASNNATDDGPQYGRPEQVPVAENGEAPPISSDNSSPPQVGDEQTAIPSEPAASGAIPQGDDNSVGTPALPQGDNGEAPGGNNTIANPQQVMRYLQRAGAMQPEQAKAVEASVAQPDKNATTLAAVQKLASQGDEQPAFDYLQYKAKRYEAFMAHAAAALNGTRERPPSLDAAIASANEAFTDLPDPTDVRFRKGEGGVEAYVRPLDPAMGKGQRYNLSIDQFKQLTAPGGAAQWDKAIAAGADGLIKQIAPSTAPGAAPIGRFGRDPNTGQDFTEGNRPSTPSEVGDMAMMRRNADMGAAMANGDSTDKIAKKFGPDPRRMGGEGGVLSFPGYKAYQQKYNAGRNTDGGPDTTPSADNKTPVRVFGQGGEGNERTYINGADQTPTKQDNALELIKARGEARSTGKGPARDYAAEIKAKHDARMEELKLTEGGKTSRATAGIDSRVKIAADKLIESAKNREASNGRNSASNAERLMASKMIATGGKLDPDDVVKYKQMRDNAPVAPQPTTPQAPQAQAPQVPTVQSPGDAHKLAPGTVYMTPDGRKFTR